MSECSVQKIEVGDRVMMPLASINDGIGGKVTAMTADGTLAEINGYWWKPVAQLKLVAKRKRWWFW